MKKSIYIQGADRSETIDLPVSSALIRHKQGNVLFDTAVILPRSMMRRNAGVPSPKS